MIIDFHIHVGGQGHWPPWVVEWLMTFRERSGLDRVLDGEGSMRLEALEKLLEEAGVDYGVCLAEISPITTGVVSNEFVAEFCSKSRRLIPFCNINPHLVTDPAKELVRCVQDFGCRGLKLHPPHQHFYPNDRRLYPLYAKAEELEIPVLIHTGSSLFKGARLKYGEPLFLDDVAVDFPGLTLILAHGGRGFWYDQAFFLAQLHPNVYIEISGLPPKNLLQYFPRLDKLAERVIFGSDWPGVPGLGENIAAIRSLRFGEEAKAKILGGNAQRILSRAIAEKGA